MEYTNTAIFYSIFDGCRNIRTWSAPYENRKKREIVKPINNPTKGGGGMHKKLLTTLLITAILFAAFPLRIYADELHGGQGRLSTGHLSTEEMERAVLGALTAGGMTFETQSAWDAFWNGFSSNMLEAENTRGLYRQLETELVRGALVGGSEFVRWTGNTMNSLWNAAADYISGRVSGQINTGRVTIPAVIFESHLFIGVVNGIPVVDLDRWNSAPNAQRVELMKRFNVRDTVINGNEYKSDDVRIERRNVCECCHGPSLETIVILGNFSINGNIVMNPWGRERRYVNYSVTENAISQARRSGLIIGQDRWGSRFMWSSVMYTLHTGSTVTERIALGAGQPLFFTNQIEDKIIAPSIDMNIHEANMLNRLDELITLIESLSGTLDEILLRIPDNLADLLGKTTEYVIIHQDELTPEPSPSPSPDPTPSPPPHVCEHECEDCEDNNGGGGWWSNIFEWIFNIIETTFEILLGGIMSILTSLGRVLTQLVISVVELANGIINRATEGVGALFDLARRLMSDLPQHFGQFPLMLTSLFALIPDEFMLLLTLSLVLLVIVAVKKRFVG
ncbi:MAG: hypothetical protein FWD90_12285 [Defluviitaleaceae bacterium]|nr:hypothetical protein [Defluviitaleaceae bacterium]